jgi:ABC-2 type transport system ATP-binding protein
MIEVQGLRKDYGTVVAVHDLSFRVGRGEVVGFLGPNGAGKTTTLRMIAGSLGPTRGRVSVMGFDVVDQPIEARRHLGYMPEACPLYPELTVREYVRFRARLRAVPRARQKGAVDRALERAGVRPMADVRIGHLSKGYRQRVGLADALVSEPPLLILDEPTAGLDPNQIREVRKLIADLGSEHTVLLSTHILSEVESTCDRALVIDRGRILAEGTLDELRAQAKGASLVVEVLDEAGIVEALLGRQPGVSAVQAVAAKSADHRAFIVTVDEADARDPMIGTLAKVLVESGVALRRIAPEQASLDEVVRALTAVDAGPGESTS